MTLIRVKGIQLSIAKHKWGRSRTCTYFTIIFTFMYVTMFAKYAHFQMDFLDRDEREEPSEEPIVTDVSSRFCHRHPDTLTGVITIDTYNDPPSFEETALANHQVHEGGLWHPEGCEPKQKIAIIIPYRERKPHLQYLLSYLHPLLQRQQKYYRIYVIEQANNDTFNKGRVMNIGFQQAVKDDSFDCFIFHDVDMIPQNDHNLYECGNHPRHLSPALDEMRYTLMYSTLVGGVLALSKEQVVNTNGYSNLYWGWGSEDDDMSLRIQSAGYKINRPPSRIGRYKMIRHQKREIGMERFMLFADWKRWPNDGVNSLDKLNYKILAHKPESLYTNITVDIGPKPESILPEGQTKTTYQLVLNIIFFLVSV